MCRYSQYFQLIQNRKCFVTTEGFLPVWSKQSQCWIFVGKWLQMTNLSCYYSHCYYDEKLWTGRFSSLLWRQSFSWFLQKQILWRTQVALSLHVPISPAGKALTDCSSWLNMNLLLRNKSLYRLWTRLKKLNTFTSVSVLSFSSLRLKVSNTKTGITWEEQTCSRLNISGQREEREDEFTESWCYRQTASIAQRLARLRRGVEGKHWMKIIPVLFPLNCTDSETKNIHVSLSFRSRFHQTAEFTADSKSFTPGSVFTQTKGLKVRNTGCVSNCAQ